MNSINVERKLFTKLIIKRIKHNIASVPTTKSMSEELGVSTRTLQSKLELEGTTYKAILRIVRLIHACNLMRGTDLKIKEITKVLGYKTRRQFDLTFRSIFGISAQQYKDNYTTYLVNSKYKIKLVDDLWYKSGAGWIGKTRLTNESDIYIFLSEAQITLEYIQLINESHEYSSATIVEYH